MAYKFKAPRRLEPPGAVADWIGVDMSHRTCSVDDCGRKILARQMCSLHYQRVANHGSTDDPRTPWQERFWLKVERTDTCWNWTGYVDPALGYGLTYRNGKRDRVHRISYEITAGPIPPGMMIDHRCHNRRCVNPDHLRLATMKQNQENRTGAIVTSKSGVRGVSWSAGNRRWLVTIGHNGKTVYGGQFKELAHAEAAAIALRNELFTHNDADANPYLAIAPCPICGAWGDRNHNEDCPNG